MQLCNNSRKILLLSKDNNVKNNYKKDKHKCREKDYNICNDRIKGGRKCKTNLLKLNKDSIVRHTHK